MEFASNRVTYELEQKLLGRMIWLVLLTMMMMVLGGAVASDDSPPSQTKQNQSRDQCLSFFSIFSLHFFTVCYLFFHSIKIWIFTLERKIPRFHLHKRRTKHTHAHTWQFSSLSLINRLHYTFFLPTHRSMPHKTKSWSRSSCVSKITTKKHSHTSAKN